MSSEQLPPKTIVPGQLPPGQSPPRTIAPWTNAPWTIAPGLFPSRIIAPWTILLDDSHLGLLYCLRIVTPGQLLPRAMTITNYNFPWLFCVSFPWLNYIISVICYDNKNNNDSSRKICGIHYKIQIVTKSLQFTKSLFLSRVGVQYPAPDFNIMFNMHLHSFCFLK